MKDIRRIRTEDPWECWACLNCGGRAPKADAPCSCGFVGVVDNALVKYQNTSAERAAALRVLADTLEVAAHLRETLVRGVMLGQGHAQGVVLDWYKAQEIITLRENEQRALARACNDAERAIQVALIDVSRAE